MLGAKEVGADYMHDVERRSKRMRRACSPAKNTGAMVDERQLILPFNGSLAR